MKFHIPCVLLTVALFACLASGADSAEILFEDNFDGTTLDTGKWITSGTGTVSVVDGNVTIDVPSGDWAFSQIDSTETWVANSDIFFSFTVGELPQGNYNIFQAFEGTAQTGYVAMRNDHGDGGWWFDAREAAAGSATYHGYDQAGATAQTMDVGDVFMLQLGPTGSAAYKNGVMFDSTTVVPTGPVMVDAQSWRAPGAFASQTFDYISVSGDNYIPPDPDPDPEPEKLVKQPDILSNNAMETTPFIWQGQPYLFESYRTTVTSPCDEYLTIKDLTTGVESAPFGHGYSLGCAYVNGNEINVYAAEEHPTNWFQDIYRFTSTDMVNWTKTLAIPKESEHLLNSSVCEDPTGYIMAYESDNPVGFCFKFAHSTDLATWEKLSVPAFAGPSGTEYSACPVIRYNSDDSYYYVIYLVNGQGEHAGEHVSNIIRSKDLINWEYSDENPMLAPIAGEGTNNSDVDLYEIDGETHVYYADGDQATWLELKYAIYDGPLSQFLMSYFPSPLAGDANVDGTVDVSDLGILATNYGNSSGMTWGNADFNSDNAVNVTDLGILATNYGTSAATASSVPEPSVVMLLVGIALSIVFIRRR